MTVTPPRSKVITDKLWAHCQALTGINWYRGEVPDHPPTITGDDRVAAYAVLYPFPGKPGPSGDLAWSDGDIDYGCQVTVAAGYCEDCEFAVDKVAAWLSGWSPAIDGVNAGFLVPPVGYDPGPVRIDRTIAPPRFSLPLQYRLTATSI